MKEKALANKERERNLWSKPPDDVAFGSNMQDFDMINSKTEELSERIVTDKEEDPQMMNDLFKKFCNSSTIHGTYFWVESRSAMSKVMWGIIVFLGIASATLIIRSSFNSWDEHPVVTSVWQIPIEEVEFPAITICPLDDTK